MGNVRTFLKVKREKNKDNHYEKSGKLRQFLGSNCGKDTRSCETFGRMTLFAPLRVYSYRSGHILFLKLVKVISFPLKSVSMK